MDISALEEFGLSEAEAKIYVALLERGPSKTGKIIDGTKLQSSTVYHVLGALGEKGIVSYIFKGKVKWYQAENPEALLAFLEEKKRKFEEILPELKAKEKASKQKLSAKVFEGIKGLKAAFNDILISMKKGEEYCFFQFSKEKLLDEEVLLFLRNYHIKIAEKGIKVKGLAPVAVKKIMKPIYSLPHTRVRFLKEIIPTGIVVYKDKVMTLDWEDVPAAFIIQSNAVANSYREFFEEKWKQARK